MTEEFRPTFFKFQKTPRSSLVSHLMILASELRSRSLAAEDPNEQFWYKDAAALVDETLFRYDQLAIEKELRESETIQGVRIDSDR